MARRSVPCAEVVAIAGMQREERLAGSVGSLPPYTNALLRPMIVAVSPSTNQAVPSSSEIPSSSGKARHQRVGEIGQPFARHDVLVDADAAQKAKALLVARRHDDRVADRAPADQKAGEDGRAGRRPAHDAAAGEDVVECLLRLGAGVGIHQVPLAAALEPDAARLLERRHEAVGVGDGAIDRMQHDDVLRAGRLQPPRAAPVGRIRRVAARRRHVDDQGIGPAGEFHELPHNSGPMTPPPTTSTAPRGGPTRGAGAPAAVARQSTTRSAGANGERGLSASHLTVLVRVGLPDLR